MLNVGPVVVLTLTLYENTVFNHLRGYNSSYKFQGFLSLSKNPQKTQFSFSKRHQNEVSSNLIRFA